MILIVFLVVPQSKYMVNGVASIVRNFLRNCSMVPKTKGLEGINGLALTQR
jgi:hypothetical protein